MRILRANTNRINIGGTTLFIILLIFCNSISSCIPDDPPPNDNEYTVNISSIHDLNINTDILDSHASETSKSVLEKDYRRYCELNSSILVTKKANYSRIKKINDNKYIMFYQDGKIGWNIYYSTSTNLKNWSTGKKLFSSYKVLNNTDDRCFSTCDGIVLENGDLLAVCSYRNNLGYRIDPENNGLMMRRSQDGGDTWSDEEIIYTGTNWEPYILQLNSGEIQVYFTDTDPIMGNSGTSIVCSFDSGKTWQPDLGESPYKVIRQITEVVDGTTIFTDQMPCARVLNNGTDIATVLESRLSNDSYWITFAYTENNWVHLQGTQEGPEERYSNVFLGAGPYLVQFPSGETVLSYNQSSLLRLEIGDVEAKNFSCKYTPFTGTGYWGSSEIIDSHTMLATMADIVYSNNTYDNKIMIGQFVLNHRVDASYTPILVDGKNNDWTEIMDALFIGSESKTQATFRFAQDDENIYMLIECLDNYLTTDGFTEVYLHASLDDDFNDKSLKLITGYEDGSMVAYRYNNEEWKEELVEGIISEIKFNGVFNDGSSDKGYMVELSIPKSVLDLSNDSISFNARLYDNGVFDSFTSKVVDNPADWLMLNLSTY